MPDLNSIPSLTGAPGPEALQRLAEAMQASRTPEGAATGDGVSFSQMVGDLLTHVDQVQKQADVSIQKLAEGDSVSLQDVVLRMEEADLTFRLMKEIRDKLISAYKEVMSMQG